MREAYCGKKILVTGAGGFIGSALAKSFSAMKVNLSLLDQSANDFLLEDCDAQIVFLEGDVSKREVWDTALPNVDYVFHLAGKEYIRGPGYDPLLDLQSNALPVLHLLESCREHVNRPTIIFASSANVFGMAKTLPVDEAHHDDPLISWAVHKLMAEGYLRSYAHQYGVRSVILRLANVYGPTVRRSALGRVVVNGMIARALAGEDLALYTNRDCVRDYVFLADVVHALLLAGLHVKSQNETSAMFVIGSGEGVTIGEAWKLIANRVSLFTGRNVEVKFDSSIDVGPFEMRNFVADTKKFQSATGWKPEMDLQNGIDLTIQALADLQSQS